MWVVCGDLLNDVCSLDDVQQQLSDLLDLHYERVVVLVVFLVLADVEGFLFLDNPVEDGRHFGFDVSEGGQVLRESVEEGRVVDDV